MIAAIEAGCELYRLASAEKELLEQTLRRSLETLTEILSLTAPAAYGRASRLQRLAAQLVAHLGIENGWHIEIAATLSQLGAVVLPDIILEKLRTGESLTEEEEKSTQELPKIAASLLEPIPRLEPVIDTIVNAQRNFDNKRRPPSIGAQILRLVQDYDSLLSKGYHSATVLDTLRGRVGAYDPDLIEALAKLLGNLRRRKEIKELNVPQLREGMIFAEDLNTKKGMLLVPRGNEVTLSMLKRFDHFPHNAFQEPVRMIVAVESL